MIVEAQSGPAGVRATCGLGRGHDGSVGAKVAGQRDYTLVEVLFSENRSGGERGSLRSEALDLLGDLYATTMEEATVKTRCFCYAAETCQ